MPDAARTRGIQAVLWLLPFVPITLLAYRYDGLRMYMIAGGIQAVLIGVAAWILGLGAARRGTVQQRELAAGAALMVAAGAILSLGWNMGPPPGAREFLATQADQQFRYSTLLIGAILSLGGLTLVRSSLQQAGDRVISSLGYSAIVLSTMLFVVDNAALQIGFEAVRQQADTGREPSWVEAFRNYFVYLTIFWAILTYIATACYAASLRKVGWMGSTAAWLFIGASAIAILAVPFLPLAPGTAGMPAFFLSIPAVPYFMLYWIGVNLAKRAGEMKLARAGSA